MTKRRFLGQLGAALVAGFSLGGAATASAQAPFPNKPVRIILPYAAGGGGDQFTRLFAQALSDVWQQSVVVDNRPGAGATIGTNMVAKAPPDGYTLLMISSTIAVTPSAYSKLPYDTFTDLAPIGLFARSPFILAVNPGVPASTMEELLRYAKENPGKLNVGHAGNGTMAHLTYELLKARAGLQATAVAYKGSNPALVDALSGQVDMIIDTPAAIGQHVRTGKLRPLAATTAKRATAMPDLPTIAESGIADFDVSVWFGLMAPGGTPPALVQKIHADAQKAFTASGIAARLGTLGMEPLVSSPAEFQELLRKDAAKWAQVVKSANIKFD
ncbi:tripartite tricarboxylate transporter substrate binding protein [Hydrogenophaga sp.]|uniref:Bug family tripartite tricarboxylate transporter substrate binding protein n=1 Tax=Hydrogenophaga sp. TaxID=1904254 RepID=UPI0027184F1C|nr:tripartite tricarboxylate transporter substrate binding protein [Hydrogenophaga sp.]MDO9437013.1 tripartite tricarboxylate transporter substrate binding protein [Hydrogenophaga sp.]